MFLGDERAAEIEPSVADVALIVEAMPLDLVCADEVEDVVAAGREQLGDQPAVAAPPRRLGAHEAGRRRREGALERLLPLGAGDARGVAPERRDANAREPLLARL